MTSKFTISTKMLASGVALLALSTSMAMAQSAAPACIGSQDTDCVPGGGVNGATGSSSTQNPNGVLMTPGQTPNGLRTAPGTNSMGGTGPGIGTTGSGVGSTTSPAPSTGSGMGMGATPGAGSGASGGASGGSAK